MTFIQALCIALYHTYNPSIKTNLGEASTHIQVHCPPGSLMPQTDHQKGQSVPGYCGCHLNCLHV